MRYAIPAMVLVLLALVACQPHNASKPAPSSSTNGTSTARASSAKAPETASQSRSAQENPQNMRVSAAPSGVFQFSKDEAYKSMTTYRGHVVALYAIKMRDGTPGHLIVVKSDRFHNKFYSVAQPDVSQFKLHRGEKVITVRYAQFYRVLPFNAPAPGTGG